MREIWVNCLDFEKEYKVSNLGRVINLNKNKIISQTKTKSNSNGSYLVVKLSKNKKSYSFKVHRLVMYSFYGKSNLSVNHINGIKNDNRLNNLEYATSEEQNSHAEKLKIRPYKSKRRILLFTHTFNKEFESIKEGVRYISNEKQKNAKNIQSNITHVLNGRAKSIYGYACKYID